MSEFGELVASVGFPAALVLILVVALWRVGKWAAPLGAKVVEEHIIFLDATKNNAKRTAVTLEKQTDLLGDVKKTNRGLVHLVDAAEAALSDDNQEARTALEKMRAELEQTG